MKRLFENGDYTDVSNLAMNEANVMFMDLLHALETRMGDTVDLRGEATDIATLGRHDPCVGIRATPIAEAMLALVLMDHALRQRGQNGEIVVTTPQLPATKS